jgi:hypothetical protein
VTGFARFNFALARLITHGKRAVTGAVLVVFWSQQRRSPRIRVDSRA